jgi:hypothetical protein
MIRIDTLKKIIKNQFVDAYDRADLKIDYNAKTTELIVSFTYGGVAMKYTFQVPDTHEKAFIVYSLHTPSFYLVAHVLADDVEEFFNYFFDSVAFSGEISALYLLHINRPTIHLVRPTGQTQAMTDKMIEKICDEEMKVFKQKFFYLFENKNYHVVRRQPKSFLIEDQAESKPHA